LIQTSYLARESWSQVETKGMGEAIVKRLRQAGASVITTARSIPENLQSPETVYPV